MSDRPRYRLVVESLPSDVPAPVRLRGVLKRLLRSFAFRAVSVEEVSAAPSRPATAAGGRGDPGRPRGRNAAEDSVGEGETP